MSKSILSTVNPNTLIRISIEELYLKKDLIYYTS